MPRKPRKDIMKPQAPEYGEPVKPEGGMAHSLKAEGLGWGGKLPPYPRSALNSNKHTVRSGMALVK